MQLQGHTGVGGKGRCLNPIPCQCGDRHHLASNIVIMLPSELNGKTKNCIENVGVKGVGISGFSFAFFEIWNLKFVQLSCVSAVMKRIYHSKTTVKTVYSSQLLNCKCFYFFFPQVFLFSISLCLSRTGYIVRVFSRVRLWLSLPFVLYPKLYFTVRYIHLGIEDR